MSGVCYKVLIQFSNTTTVSGVETVTHARHCPINLVNIQ